jgi:hypothetical protein
MIVPEKFDGIVDAVEKMVRHLNYYKTARMPEQAREFTRALSSPDDFWLAVKQKAVELKRPSCGFLDGIGCGAIVSRTATVARPCKFNHR